MNKTLRSDRRLKFYDALCISLQNLAGVLSQLGERIAGAIASGVPTAISWNSTR